MISAVTLPVMKGCCSASEADNRQVGSFNNNRFMKSIQLADNLENTSPL
jgi:hypothetical protein